MSSRQRPVRTLRLNEAAPDISERDIYRLMDFRPRPTRIAIAVKVAMMHMEREAKIARLMAARAARASA